MSITVVGSMNMDYILQVDELPRRGETVVSNRFSTAPGGKGANQAAAAARLGASVRMVGCVGKDAAGDALVRNLQAFGVDTSAVEGDAGEPTGSAFITVSASGDNLLVVHRGANFRLPARQCRASEPAIAGSNVLVTQFEVPMDAVVEALRIARRHGLTTIVNPAPAVTQVPREVLQLADFLVPNETEAASLLASASPGEGAAREGREVRGVQEVQEVQETQDARGRDLAGVDEALNAARSLARLTSGTVIITLGRNGCVCSRQGADFAVPAFQVKAVDSTAAGDAFIGALAFKLERGGFDLEAAVRFASAAGAMATTRVGAQPSLPSLEEVERLVESCPEGRSTG